MKAINIISFDVPFPANYGGVIDVFYKIKAFHNLGIEVHLHCFEYGRGKQIELEKICATINYYKRKKGVGSFLSQLPYIVKSRVNQELRKNLLKNHYPILFEGLHCCYLLKDTDLKNRFKIVRTHNVEHHYYAHLAKSEKFGLRKRYYSSESRKLKQFESILDHANLSLAISKNDYNYFTSKYPSLKVIHISAFHQNNSIKIKEGVGDYVLYHGNLSVNENKEAVKFIINNVFKNIDTPLIIAGLNPDKEIIK